jgi:hypothetical protein
VAQEVLRASHAASPSPLSPTLTGFSTTHMLTPLSRAARREVRGRWIRGVFSNRPRLPSSVARFIRKRQASYTPGKIGPADRWGAGLE